MNPTNDQTKKEQPSAEDWKKWGEEIYTPYYESKDSNPDEPPPPPPGPIKP
jgi:hypothetical protein